MLGLFAGGRNRGGARCRRNRRPAGEVDHHVHRPRGVKPPRRPGRRRGAPAPARRVRADHHRPRRLVPDDGTCTRRRHEEGGRNDRGRRQGLTDSAPHPPRRRHLDEPPRRADLATRVRPRRRARGNPRRLLSPGPRGSHFEAGLPAEAAWRGAAVQLLRRARPGAGGAHPATGQAAPAPRARR